MEKAENLTNSTNIAIAAYKVREAEEIEQSKLRFEQNKTCEQNMNKPCDCADGQRLLRIDWTKRGKSNK